MVYRDRPEPLRYVYVVLHVHSWKYSVVSGEMSLDDVGHDSTQRLSISFTLPLDRLQRTLFVLSSSLRPYDLLPLCRPRLSRMYSQTVWQASTSYGASRAAEATVILRAF